VEAELQALLDQHAGPMLSDGRRTLVRNGLLPKHTVQTGIGDVTIKAPKIRDCSDSEIKFNTALLPPYFKPVKRIEEPRR